MLEGCNIPRIDVVAVLAFTSKQSLVSILINVAALAVECRQTLGTQRSPRQVSPRVVSALV
jgi:hypothetical protein